MMARRLMAQSGVANSEDQYNASLLAIYPIQQLYDWAAGEGRLEAFRQPGSFRALLNDVPEGYVQRLFLHGPGGSGKTYFVNEVVLPVLRHFCPGAFQAMASQNSAARLIGGATMHAMGAMCRGQNLSTRKPSLQAMVKLKQVWEALVGILLDEASLMPPELLAAVNVRAGWARCDRRGGQDRNFTEHTFGDILLQIMLGDFLQLNPVLSHTLLEAFLENTGITVPRVPVQTSQMDKDGYQIFRGFCKQVVLFRGSHRFVPNDPLAQLLEIMRQPGGGPVPEELRRRIAARIQRGEADPRAGLDYCQKDRRGNQIGPVGFFAKGFFSAINWEQVARLEQIWARQTALRTTGPVALQNTPRGRPQCLHWGWPPAADTSALRVGRLPIEAARLVAAFLHSNQQLIYYAQAVDRPSTAGFAGHSGFVEQALAVANRNVTGGLMGMLPLFLGMRVKLTKKVLAPELVQEASGEIVGIAFHDQEGFRHTISAKVAPTQPPESHPCWERGWVVLDHLPKYVAVRFDDQTEDYTGLGRPGVFLVEPHQDTWQLLYKTGRHINHPLAAERVVQGKSVKVQVRRYQLPLAPERVGTYQGQQGKTIRGPDKEPLGHTVDLRRPSYMDPSEYFQHLYMILGRARSLDWCLLRNFPETPEGQPDWSVFETGPPDFLVHFFEILEQKARDTKPRIETVRVALKHFPPWAARPALLPHTEEPGRYIYNKEDWDRALPKESESVAPVRAGKKRLSEEEGSSSSKRPAPGEPERVTAACASQKRPPEEQEGSSSKRPRGKSGSTAVNMRQHARPFGADQR
jgi:hypothetical protein